MNYLQKIYRSCLLLFAFLLVSMNTYATNRYVNKAATGTNNGSSWTNAYISLQSALAASASGDKIYIAKGTYIPTLAFDIDGSNGIEAREVTFQIRSGVEVYGGFAGTETGAITQAILDARNFATNTTILSGDINGNDNVTGTFPNLVYNGYAENAFHVVYTSYVSSATIVDGLTIRNGNANGSIFLNRIGGGWSNTGGTSSHKPTLRNINFSQNIAEGYGGGMFSRSASASLLNCSFFQNRGDYGGGWCSLNSSNTTNLVNCSFSQNDATIGGGMWVSSSSASLVNCSFSQNNATNQGGGIYNGGSRVMSISNSVFWGNAAANGNSWFNQNATTTANYTLIEEAALPAGTTGANNKFNQDPLFVNAATGDLRLSVGSPAINAGSNALIPAGVTTDLAGNPRIYNSGIVDMGAYEFIPSPEINLQGNSTDIASGSTTPIVGNDTDFGSVATTKVVTYTIQNTGTANLTLSSIVVSGTNVADFGAGEKVGDFY